MLTFIEYANMNNIQTNQIEAAKTQVNDKKIGEMKRST